MRLIALMIIFLLLAAFSTGFTFADFTGPEVKAVTRALMFVTGPMFLALLIAVIVQSRGHKRMAKEDE
ncbi:MAG: hypothetical protein GVY16_02445 [Planctomycetes bacterium]|jgi:uncharacterized membrane protein (DUF485 family)|nr:hypothetical protein [Phycisphaerae bacterium]NBB94577.1 hypothetical protein [Planctomycetota bacterium]